MNVLDRLDQLEREASPGPWPYTSEEYEEIGALEVDAEFVSMARTHLRALLDVAQAAERARIDGVVTDDGIYIRPNASMNYLWTALAPLLEEQ